MASSTWKVPFFESFFLRSIKKSGSPFVGSVPAVWSSRLFIFEDFIGSRLSLYNGKKFFPVKVKSAMMGSKVGEFRVTKVISGNLKMHGRMKRKRKVTSGKKQG